MQKSYLVNRAHMSFGQRQDKDICLVSGNKIKRGKLPIISLAMEDLVKNFLFLSTPNYRIYI